MGGWRAWDATLGKPEDDPEADAAYEQAAERRDALLDAAEGLPPTLDNVLAKALAICWLEYAGEVSPGKRRSEQSFTGRIALDIHEAIIGEASACSSVESVDWHAPPPGFMASPAIEPLGFVRIPEGIVIELGRLRGIALAEFGRRADASSTAEGEERLRRELHLDVLSRAGSVRGEFAVPADALNLVSLVNLASATLSELQTVRDTAKCLGDVAYAFSWGDRCRGAMDRGSADRGTAAHKLVTSLGDALTAVEYAAEREAERRSAGRRCDRKTRLYTLAPSVIDNEDPDELEAFAHELLDYATAQREGR